METTGIPVPRQAEEAALNREKQLRLIADSIPALVCYLDRDLIYRFANGAYKTWFGFEPSELIGRHLSYSTGPVSLESIRPYLDRAFAGEQVSFSTKLTYPTAGTRCLKIDYTPDVGFDGIVRGVVCLINNVTEQVLAREALEAQQEELRQMVEDRQASLRRLESAMRARDEFLSVASHELRTPLTILKLHSDLRLRKLEKTSIPIDRAQLETDIRKDLKHIEQINRLVSDMLDVSRIHSGKLSVRKEWFDIRELIADVDQRFRPSAEADGVDIRIELCEDPLMGFWDRFRLEQVYVNLLTNAIRYGRKRPVHVRVFRQGSDAVVSVSDEGIGIDKSNQGRIFQRFERAVSPSEMSGLGLGLYISREIMAQHGGVIEVESEVGKGSVFSLRLPLGDGGRFE